MMFKKLVLENWRNFLHAEMELRERIFVVGANASGKSNLLDAFRFLRDIADPRGGLQQAVERRMGVSKIRSLHARANPDILVEATVDVDDTLWRYRLAFSQDKQRRPLVKAEQVWKGAELLLNRPNDDDHSDPGRLAQTNLEQVNANKEFRAIAEFFAQVRYLHLIPHLVREPERYSRTERDPFGSDFLEQLGQMQKDNKRTFESRLNRINQALRVAIPQLSELKLERDSASGRPHLKGLYEHWRPGAGWQQEDQFSDGTLRLCGLLWSLLDGNGPLLLEEPELSLHEAIVRQLPAMMWTVGRKSRRQVILSTHSAGMLSDVSIGSEEALLLTPTQEGTAVRLASSIAEVQALMGGGMSLGEALLPIAAPRNPEQLVFPFAG